jgi:hypothetical protein
MITHDHGSFSCTCAVNIHFAEILSLIELKKRRGVKTLRKEHGKVSAIMTDVTRNPGQHDER